MIRPAILALALVLLSACGKTEQKPAPQSSIWPTTKPAAVEKPPHTVAPKVEPRRAVKPVKAKKAKKAKREKPEKHEKRRERKRVASLPSWCSRVPSWATMGQVEFAATARGMTMTDKDRAQAQRCLDSKK